LSRLWAFEITGNVSFADAAKRAGTTIFSSVHQIAFGAETSYGLCHGLAGNADILETLRARLEMPAFASAVIRIAKEIADHVISLNTEGRKGRSDPSLMLGTAGLGAFLLHAGGSIAMSLLTPNLVVASSVPRPTATD
jgi:hypothetical protein